MHFATGMDITIQGKGPVIINTTLTEGRKGSSWEESIEKGVREKGAFSTVGLSLLAGPKSQAVFLTHRLCLVNSME